MEGTAMSVIDIQQLLQNVSEAAPCGKNLEYSDAFREMEEASVGKPEQEFGETRVPAEDPDWRLVRDKSLALFKETKDLRVALYLGKALLSLDGFPGFAEGVELIRRMLEQHWDHLHPELDHDDNDDPTMRINTLAELADPTFVRLVREEPLVRSKMLGKFSLRDVEIATGKIPAPQGEAELPSSSNIDAAFLECDLTELQSTCDGVGLALQGIRQMAVVLSKCVDGAGVPDISPLEQVLASARKELTERLARRGVGSASEVAPAEAGGNGPSVVVPRPPGGDINSREDIVRLLDKMCDYLRKNEPASPVPLLLQRAKRLVSKNFMEIMQDIAPDGVTQVKTIVGLDTDDSGG
jgi:type VI secretion system protein ImpA